MNEAKVRKYAVIFLVIFVLVNGLMSDDFKQRNKHLTVAFKACRAIILLILLEEYLVDNEAVPTFRVPAAVYQPMHGEA